MSAMMVAIILPTDPENELHRRAVSSDIAAMGPKSL
jgi:hypothetical protein